MYQGSWLNYDIKTKQRYYKRKFVCQPVSYR